MSNAPIRRRLLAILLTPLLLAFAAIAIVNAQAPRLPSDGPDVVYIESAFALGRAAHDAGDDEAALYYWRRVAPGDPDRARALRHIGWKIHARRRARPAEGVAYVNRSLLLDPFDGNVWQDLVRIYGLVLLP